MQNLQLRHLHLERAASRLIAAATRAAQSELVIPRQPEVSDGSWDKADVRLVQQAINDSLSGSRERTVEPGKASSRLCSRLSLMRSKHDEKGVRVAFIRELMSRRHGPSRKEFDRSAGLCTGQWPAQIPWEAAL